WSSDVCSSDLKLANALTSTRKKTGSLKDSVNHAGNAGSMDMSAPGHSSPQSMSPRSVERGSVIRITSSRSGLRLLRRRQRNGLVLAGQKRRDASHGYAAVCPFWSFRRNLQILLAVTLRRQVFSGYPELLAEHERHRFSPTIRK